MSYLEGDSLLREIEKSLNNEDNQNFNEDADNEEDDLNEVHSAIIDGGTDTDFDILAGKLTENNPL